MEDTLAEAVGRVLEHVLPVVDDAFDGHISGGIAFFEDRLDQIRDVMPVGVAVAEKKDAEKLKS